MTRRPRPRPLRVRLVALVVALTAAGLLAAGAIATALLRGYLTDRVDEQLRDTARPIAGAPAPVPDDRQAPGPTLPGRFYVQAVDAAGGDPRVLSVPRDAAGGVPDLATPTLAEARAAAGAITTVPSQGGGPGWRALVVPLADGSGSVTIAASLADVSATVGRLVWLQVVVGGIVVLLVGGLGWLLVRRSLRPLVDVEVVAGQIASGDLSRRVPGADDVTEVGQLATAFNTMVDRIQAAFAARESSEAAARESEERMRRFVADAGHELRTPLTSVRGFAELYRQGALTAPADVGHAMGRIESEAGRMGLLVDDLLLLARLDTQRPLARSPVDLAAVAADVVHDARVVAPDRSLTLVVEPGPLPPIVVGDEARLHQVVGNLVTNAVRHTPTAAAVSVTVAVEGDRAVLGVRDTGPGLAPEAAARVFERFYRADDARSRDDGGTGLGLAIVDALVRAHGGRVELETAPGAGATFRVLLPLAGVEAS